jgi:hypothetical protein
VALLICPWEALRGGLPKLQSTLPELPSMACAPFSGPNAVGSSMPIHPPTRLPCPALLPGPHGRLANHVIAENQYLDFVSGYLG